MKKRWIISFLLLLLIIVSVVSWFLVKREFGEVPESTEVTEDTSSITIETKESFSIESSESEWLTETTDSSMMEAIELDLETTLLQEAAEKVYVGVYFLESQKELRSDSSEQTPSASLIKVFIMEYIFDQIRQEEIHLDESIDGTGLEVLLKNMIQLSDNQATNRLIEYFGMETLNEYFENQGYNDTELQRMMLDNQARNQGLDNYTSLNDCMTYLITLYEGQEDPLNQQMLTILKGQQIRTKISSQLPANIEVANKTGELDGVENDMGIIFANEPFVLVVLSNGVYELQTMRNAIGTFTVSAFEEANKDKE
ncbi:serine hydrolase [Enterococcus olivae]